MIAGSNVEIGIDQSTRSILKNYALAHRQCGGFQKQYFSVEKGMEECFRPLPNERFAPFNNRYDYIAARYHNHDDSPYRNLTTLPARRTTFRGSRIFSLFRIREIAGCFNTQEKTFGERAFGRAFEANRARESES